MEELSVPQRLRQSVREVQARHLLVTDLGVEADHLRVLQLTDEREGMSDGREENVAARLVGLRLECKTNVVALFDHVAGEDVEGLLVPVECRAHILCGAGLSAVAPTPEHHRARAELGGQVEVVRDLADREPAYVAVVRGETAVPEYRMREEVGGHHLDHQSGTLRGAAQAPDRGAFL